jgi:hypothetical protein
LCVSYAFGVTAKANVLKVFFQEFYSLGPMVRSLIHYELIFVNDVK